MRLPEIFYELKDSNELKKNQKLEDNQMKNKLKSYKSQITEVTEERDSIKNKYIALLEEKGEGFSQYLYWQEQAHQAIADEKETRKEMQDFKKDIHSYDVIIGKVFNREPITSLAKCEDFDSFIAYVLRLHFTDKDLPLKGIQDTCKRLDITKNMIKKESEYLYSVLNVDKWEID